MIKMVTPLFPADATKRIETEIDRYFEAAVKRAGEVNPAYQRLWETLNGLIKSGGKRFRPHMVLLAYELFGGTETPSIVPVAVAQELLHFSMLIHDDIIDRDEVRYGVPNVTGRYRSLYATHLSNESERLHFAQSAAIIGGDLMISAAYELIATSKLSPESKESAQRLLSDSIFSAAAGELMDTEASFMPYASGDALKIALLKTAHYSFVTPLVTGATLAGVSDKQCTALRQFGEALGVAYQLHDDIIGVFGDEKQTGKSGLSDIREGKRTLLVEYALESMSAVDKRVFEQAFGKSNATPHARRKAKQLLDSTGAKRRTEMMIDEYRLAALDAAGRLGLNAHGHAKLVALTERVVTI